MYPKHRWSNPHAAPLAVINVTLYLQMDERMDCLTGDIEINSTVWRVSPWFACVMMILYYAYWRFLESPQDRPIFHQPLFLVSLKLVIFKKKLYQIWRAKANTVSALTLRLMKALMGNRAPANEDAMVLLIHLTAESKHVKSQNSSKTKFKTAFCIQNTLYNTLKPQS